MSGTPKYTRVRLSEAASSRLREEARRRAAERAARGAAEAARKREERFRKDRAAFQGRLAEIQAQIAAFDGTPAGRHVAEAVRQVRVRLAQIEKKSPANEKDLARAENELHRLERDFRQTCAQGRAAQDALDLDKESASLLCVKYQANEDRQGSRRFDPDGLEQFEAALREVEKRLEWRDLAGVRETMSALGRQFERHRVEVEKRRALWLMRKEAALAALAGVQEKIAGLQANPDARRWQSSAVENIAGRVEALDKMMQRDLFEHVTKEAERLSVETKNIRKAAEARQLQQDEQDYKARCTLEALRACGLTINEISRSHEGDDADSVIHAHRTDGCALAATIPQEGAIQWTVDGFPMQVVPGKDGQPANACDEAVDQIDAIRAVLNDYGVETSDPTWAGQDPDRPKKTAKSLGRRSSGNCHQASQARLT